jgi:hypothetical protein
MLLVSRAQTDDATEGRQSSHQGNRRFIHPSKINADRVPGKPLKNLHAGYRIGNIHSQGSLHSVQ